MLFRSSAVEGLRRPGERLRLGKGEGPRSCGKTWKDLGQEIVLILVDGEEGTEDE